MQTLRDNRSRDDRALGPHADRLCWGRWGDHAAILGQYRITGSPWPGAQTTQQNAWIG